MAIAEITLDQYRPRFGFVQCWNQAKDIGTLYLTFAMCTGMIGGAMSIFTRYH